MNSIRKQVRDDADIKIYDKTCEIKNRLEIFDLFYRWIGLDRRYGPNVKPTTTIYGDERIRLRIAGLTSK